MPPRAPLANFILHTAFAILVLVLAGCAVLRPAAAPNPTLAPSAQPTSASDNPTAGAIARSTRQALATLNSRATQSVHASQTAAVSATAAAADTSTAAAQDAATATVAAAATSTAEAQDAATATVAAAATNAAINTAEHTWRVRAHDSFTDNRLGWPTGFNQDQYLGLTTTVRGGSYQWLTLIYTAQGGYANVAPNQVPAYTDFYGAVNVLFVSGNDDGQAAYGLAFRQTDQDFGFFGLFKDGHYLLVEAHGSTFVQNILASAPTMDTRPGATNRVAVVGVGPDFNVLINDAPVANFTANLASGIVGVGLVGSEKAKLAQVNFTNFEVRAP